MSDFAAKPTDRKEAINESGASIQAEDERKIYLKGNRAVSKEARPEERKNGETEGAAASSVVEVFLGMHFLGALLHGLHAAEELTDNSKNKEELLSLTPNPKKALDPSQAFRPEGVLEEAVKLEQALANKTLLSRNWNMINSRRKKEKEEQASRCSGIAPTIRNTLRRR